MSTWAWILPHFGMPDEERKRLIGEGRRKPPPPPPRRRSKPKSEWDPMDAFLWSVIGIMLAITFVYCVLFLRAAVDASFDPPAGALQALLAVIPIATLVISLRKDRK